MVSRKERSFLVGRPIGLSGLIGYQDGSIVSRMLINKAGTVTLFAFDEGEGLREHTAPYDALLVVLEGRAVVTIQDHPAVIGGRRDDHHICACPPCRQTLNPHEDDARDDPCVVQKR
jgi:hypothetical protein